MRPQNSLTILNDHSHQHKHEAVEEEEEPHFLFPSLVFDASYLEEMVPNGFDAVKISLDGKLKADLGWKKELEAARGYVAKGFRIFWEIDLGLINTLTHALSHRGQFLSLTLSLEHFCKTIWKEFRKETVGLCLFRGCLDFSKGYPWDEEQILNLQEWIAQIYSTMKDFVSETNIAVLDYKSLTVESLAGSEHGRQLLANFCRDSMSEYFSLLAAGIPDSLPLFLLLDAKGIENPFFVAQMLNKAYFSRYHLGVKNSSRLSLGGDFSWEGSPLEKGGLSRQFNTPVKSKRFKLAFCLPSEMICRVSTTQVLKQAFEELQRHEVSFRVIPERELAVEWDGLDELIVDTHFVSFQFKRKLQGFCAAGGRVISLRGQLGLPDEISFNSWLNMLIHPII